MDFAQRSPAKKPTADRFSDIRWHRSGSLERAPLPPEALNNQLLCADLASATKALVWA
jgi:hypothetical protein